MDVGKTHDPRQFAGPPHRAGWSRSRLSGRAREQSIVRASHGFPIETSCRLSVRSCSVTTGRPCSASAPRSTATPNIAPPDRSAANHDRSQSTTRHRPAGGPAGPSTSDDPSTDEARAVGAPLRPPPATSAPHPPRHRNPVSCPQLRAHGNNVNDSRHRPNIRPTADDPEPTAWTSTTRPGRPWIAAKANDGVRLRGHGEGGAVHSMGTHVRMRGVWVRELPRWVGRRTAP